MSTFDASSINIFKMPESGDQVQFVDGSIWTIKQRSSKGWGLYAENNVLHSAIGEIPAMIEFCAAINQQNDFLKYALNTNTSVHRGEHYV